MIWARHFTAHFCVILVFIVANGKCDGHNPEVLELAHALLSQLVFTLQEISLAKQNEAGEFVL